MHIDPETTYLQLLDAGAARAVEVDPRFWEEIDARTELHDGRLLGVFEMNADPDHEEMHPAGDEILVLLSGAVDVVLPAQVIALRGRAACIVPRGAWHTQRVRAPSVMMFITPGRGTEHRPIRRARRTPR
jgi:hypothetical protein